jgi:hypothetical protein
MFLPVLSLITQAPSWHRGTPVFDAMKPAVPYPMPNRGRSPCGDSPQRVVPSRLDETRTTWLQDVSVMPPVRFQADFACRDTGNHCAGTAPQARRSTVRRPRGLTLGPAALH